MRNIALLFLLLMFTGCSDKKPGVKPPEAIWPYEFYNRFNLRTIVSTYSTQVKYYCASYPKDFFKPENVMMPNTEKVVIEDDKRYLSFEIVSRDQVIVVDKIKEGSYNAQHLYQIYYNEEYDDYRTDLYFIDKRDDCVKLVFKEDENVSK